MTVARVESRLDPERWDELRMLGADDPGFIPELVTTFVADMTRLLARLRQLVADGEREAARRLSHTIRGSSRTVGASHLATLTQRLDARLTGPAQTPPAPAGADMEGALALVGEMEAELAAVADELRRLAAGAAAPPR